MHINKPFIKKNECGSEIIRGSNLCKPHSSHEKDIQTSGANVNKVLLPHSKSLKMRHKRGYFSCRKHLK